MTFEQRALIAAAFLLSLTIAYAFWVKVRVIYIQERLFEIRDRLFDEARKFGCLEDSAYQDCRELLNGLIRIASTISVPTMVQLMLHASKDDSKSSQPCSSNQKMQSAIDTALKGATFELFNYLSRRTLTGLILLLSSKSIQEASQRTQGIIIREAMKMPAQAIC